MAIVRWATAVCDMPACGGMETEHIYVGVGTRVIEVCGGCGTYQVGTARDYDLDTSDPEPKLSAI